MKISPQKRGEILKILRTLVEVCGYETGCFNCHIYGDLQETDVFMFEQVWRAEDDLKQHIRSGEYHTLLLALELALQQPEIRFNVISSSTGIETIRKARGVTG